MAYMCLFAIESTGTKAACNAHDSTINATIHMLTLYLHRASPHAAKNVSAKSSAAVSVPGMRGPCVSR